MTNKEAKIILLKEKELYAVNINTQHILNAIDLAISALEKQIPSKPIITNWNPALCPSCNEELSESMDDGYYYHYTNLKVCECGQKLKWDWYSIN